MRIRAVTAGLEFKFMRIPVLVFGLALRGGNGKGKVGKSVEREEVEKHFVRKLREISCHAILS